MMKGEEDRGLIGAKVVGVKDLVKSTIEEGAETFSKVIKLFEDSPHAPQIPRQFLDTLTEQMRQNYEEMETLVAEKVAEVVDRLGLPTNQQIQDLNDRVENLVRKLESFSNSRKDDDSSGENF